MSPFMTIRSLFSLRDSAKQITEYGALRLVTLVRATYKPNVCLEVDITSGR